MISTKNTKLIPIELINEIILISNSDLTPEDFIREITLLLFNYLKINKKITEVIDTEGKRVSGIIESTNKTEDQNPIFNKKVISGVSYYLCTSKTKYILGNKLKLKNNKSDKVLKPILSNINIYPNTIIKRIHKTMKNPFLCIYINDRFMTNRIYGVILVILESKRGKSNTADILNLAHSLSDFISILFSYSFKNYLRKIKDKTYKKISLVNGFKEKIIFYEILKGLISVIPFNHSATVYIFNSRINKLVVYAEKNSESNPKYDKDSKKYFGGKQFDFSLEEFNSINKSQAVSLSYNHLSFPWLTRILSYKSKKINNVILTKFIIPPDSESLVNDYSLCGVIMICNYTNIEFTLGDVRVLNSFLGINNKNQFETDSFYNFLNKVRKNFLEMSPKLDLTTFKNTNLENLLIDLGSKIEDYLKKLAPTILAEDRSIKVNNLLVFFTTRNNPVGKFSTLSQGEQKYLLSDSFLKELDDSFYNIYTTTDNKILKKKIFGKKWNTFTAVRIPNSPNIQCLCILREVIYDISHYDRLIVKFLSEQIALALSANNSIEMLSKTSEYLQEIIKLGATNPFLSIDKYMNELLNIAIKYTDSKSGNIYTLTGDSESLALMAQKGEGEEIKLLSIRSDKGVVPYVAQHYLKYKNKPFYIDDIQAFIKEQPQIGYIAALSSMSSELTIPMLLGEDLWGILNVESDILHNYDEQKKYILLNISQKASEIWQQKQLSYALEQTGAFLKTTLDDSNTFEEPDIYKICEPQIKLLLDITIKSTSAHSATVRFLDDSAESLILYCQSDLGKKSLKNQIFYKDKPNCVVFTAIKLGEPIDIPSVKNPDKNKYYDIDYYETKVGTEAEYALPLKYFKRVDGVLNIEGSHAFTESEKLMYRTIARLIELLLMQRVYFMRRQNFDQTSLISLGLHRLDNKLKLIKDHLEEYQKSKIDISELLKKLKERSDSALKIIKPLRIPGISIEHIKLRTLVREIKSLTTWGNQIKTPKIIINKSLIDNSILANIEQFKTILKDLLDNAYRECSTVNVTFLKKWNGNLQILIEDNGDGIPEDIRKKLFKVPIKKNNKLSMGCYISGIIITDLGGRIYINKTNKNGTIIGIDIPLNN